MRLQHADPAFVGFCFYLDNGKGAGLGQVVLTRTSGSSTIWYRSQAARTQGLCGRTLLQIRQMKAPSGIPTKDVIQADFFSGFDNAIYDHHPGLSTHADTLRLQTCQYDLRDCLLRLRAAHAARSRSRRGAFERWENKTELHSPELPFATPLRFPLFFGSSRQRVHRYHGRHDAMRCRAWAVCI